MKKQKKQINELARIFYKAHGYEVEKGYDFSTASHPQEKGMYNLAEISFNFWKMQFNKKQW